MDGENGSAACSSVPCVGEVMPEARIGPGAPPIEPLFENVIVEKCSAPDQFPGKTIAIPETAKAKFKIKALVHAVGPHVFRYELNPGDVVIFTIYAGTKIDWEGKDYILLNKHDVLARVPSG